MQGHRPLPETPSGPSQVILRSVTVLADLTALVESRLSALTETTVLLEAHLKLLLQVRQGTA